MIVWIDLWIVKLVPRFVQELFKEGQLGFLFMDIFPILINSNDGILKENWLRLFYQFFFLSYDSGKARFKFLKNLYDVDDVHFFVYQFTPIKVGGGYIHQGKSVHSSLKV